MNDDSEIAKYRATIIAQIDTETLNEAIKEFLNFNAQERYRLIEQKILNMKTQQEKFKINEEIKSIYRN